MECPFPVLPGSDAERRLLSMLLTELDYHDLMYVLQPVHVVVPEYEVASVVEGSNEVEAGPLPPSPFYEGRTSNYVVADMPRDPLELKGTYRSAVEAGAELLVLRGPGFGFIPQGPGLSLQSNDYPPIPAVVVDGEVKAGSPIEVHLRGRVREGLAYNLVVDRQGDSDETVVFLTHVDSWPRTADACPAVNVMTRLVRFVASRNPRKSFRFVFATARHFGDPALPGMHWGVGHRHYFSRFDDAVLAIDFEAATTLSMVASEEAHGLLGIGPGFSPFAASVHPDMMGIPTIHLEGGLDMMGALESIVESVDSMDRVADRLAERYAAAISPSLSRFGAGNLINKIDGSNLASVRRLMTRYLVVNERKIVRPLSILDFLSTARGAEVIEVGSGFRLMGRQSPGSLGRALINDLTQELRYILMRGE
ncbi:hypothetical protein GCM10007981_12700 [Thermocladium modestius]|uniref:Peptidase M28 domain-containing protein n=1 Tax=Thermocladium modestius TaxID=62609 RepID=A0A830GV21_9CREN|nr:hypothetical protein [Thermocladium modestius]GGP21327.1 hypothetical protein GCM10007981_12700 [Thermocladium modestius]